LGLVAGVHDRTLQSGLESDLLLEELRTLGRSERPRHGRPLPVSRCPPAGAAEDLPGHEVGRDQVGDAGEGHGPVHQIVLVGAVELPLLSELFL